MGSRIAYREWRCGEGANTSVWFLGGALLVVSFDKSLHQKSSSQLPSAITRILYMYRNKYIVTDQHLNLSIVYTESNNLHLSRACLWPIATPTERPQELCENHLVFGGLFVDRNSGWVMCVMYVHCVCGARHSVLVLKYTNSQCGLHTAPTAIVIPHALVAQDCVREKQKHIQTEPRNNCRADTWRFAIQLFTVAPNTLLCMHNTSTLILIHPNQAFKYGAEDAKRSHEFCAQ